jgi:hypothetical protein
MEAYIIGAISCGAVVLIVCVLVCCCWRPQKPGSRFTNRFGGLSDNYQGGAFTFPPKKKHSELVDLEGSESIEMDLLGTT